MNIEFENAALEELYTSGTTQDHQYKRLPKDIVKRFIKVVNCFCGIIVNALLFEISKHYE